MKYFFLCLILLTSCWKYKPEPHEGCTDPEALNYEPNAKSLPKSCTYGGLLSIFRTGPNANPNDEFFYMVDTFDGRIGYQKMGGTLYNMIPPEEIPCVIGNRPKNAVYLGMDLGKWKVVFFKTENRHKDTIQISDTLTFDIGKNSCYSVKVK